MVTIKMKTNNPSHRTKDVGFTAVETIFDDLENMYITALPVVIIAIAFIRKKENTIISMCKSTKSTILVEL
jgi:hypothetical protein